MNIKHRFMFAGGPGARGRGQGGQGQSSQGANHWALNVGDIIRRKVNKLKTAVSIYSDRHGIENM